MSFALESAFHLSVLQVIAACGVVQSVFMTVAVFQLVHSPEIERSVSWVGKRLADLLTTTIVCASAVLFVVSLFGLATDTFWPVVAAQKVWWLVVAAGCAAGV